MHACMHAWVDAYVCVCVCVLRLLMLGDGRVTCACDMWKHDNHCCDNAWAQLRHCLLSAASAAHGMTSQSFDQGSATVFDQGSVSVICSGAEQGSWTGFDCMHKDLTGVHVDTQRDCVHEFSGEVLMSCVMTSPYPCV